MLLFNINRNVTLTQDSHQSHTQESISKGKALGIVANTELSVASRGQIKTK